MAELPGHKGQLAPRCRALGTMIKKFYSDIQKAVHTLRLKNFETSSFVWGGGGGHNLRCHLAGIFHTSARCPQA